MRRLSLSGRVVASCWHPTTDSAAPVANTPLIRNVRASRRFTAKISVRVLHPIDTVDATAVDRSRLDELERHAATGVQKERDTGAKQNRVHVQPHLVDQVSFQQRPREITPAHYANT